MGYIFVLYQRQGGLYLSLERVPISSMPPAGVLSLSKDATARFDRLSVPCCLASIKKEIAIGWLGCL